MNIQDVFKLVAPGMQEVNQTITTQLRSDVVLINQLAQYIINSGGKRLRPQLVLLSAAVAGYSGRQHIDVAAIIEFIHTATLLHDDVVDASDMRRGNQTANAIWGNEAAVLVGDFLYSRSFEMMVSVGSMRVMEVLSGTTNRIAEGEVLQLLNVHEADVTIAQYMEVIHAKTAKLFEAATRLGGILADVTPEQEEALAQYGMYLGTAFQIIDDVLDYSADAEEMGKNVGDDLAEGKPTLPLIFARDFGDESQAALIRAAIEKGGLEQIDEVMSVVNATQSLERSRAIALEQSQLACDVLACFPESDARNALETLAMYAVERSL